MTEKDDTEVISALKERLQFFFSDANIRADRFIRKYLKKGDKDFSGSVPIEALLRFNSIKCHTTDAAVVAKAVKSMDDFLKLEDNEKAVARVNAFTASQMDDNIPVSLFVMDLPMTDEEDPKKAKYDVSIDELKAMFEPYGEIALIKLQYKQELEGRKVRRGKPSGSARVEYTKVDSLEKAAADCLTIKDGETIEPKKALEVKGKKLRVISLKEHVANKRKEDELERANGTKGKKGDGDAKGSENGSGKKRRADDEEEEEKVKEFKIDWKPGCVIELKGIGASCDREAIKSAVESEGVSNVYADYSRGQPSGAIRFSEPSDKVKEIAEKLSKGEVTFAGEKVEAARVLEGEEEKKYWDTFIEFKNKQMRHKLEERASRRKRHRR